MHWLAVMALGKVAYIFTSFLASLSLPSYASIQGEAGEAVGIEAVTSIVFERGPIISCKSAAKIHLAGTNVQEMHAALQLKLHQCILHMYQSVIACEGS